MKTEDSIKQLAEEYSAGITLTRNSKLKCSWEIKCRGMNDKEVLERVTKLDKEMRGRFGPDEE